MTCPKITRCGHIFCWPCIENYYNYWTVTSINKKNPKCPLCKEFIIPKELKICEVNNCMNYLDSQTSNNYNEVNSDCITFNLIMKEKKGQVLYNINHDPDLSIFKNEYLNNKNSNINTPQENSDIIYNQNLHSNLNLNSNHQNPNLNLNHNSNSNFTSNSNGCKNNNNKNFSSSFCFIPLEKNEEFSYSRIFVTNKNLILKKLNDMKNILEINLKDELDIASVISSSSEFSLLGEAEDQRRINSLSKCLELLSNDLDYYYKYKEKDKKKDNSNKILNKNKQKDKIPLKGFSNAIEINLNLEINSKKSSFNEIEKEKEKTENKEIDKDSEIDKDRDRDRDKDIDNNDNDNKKINLNFIQNKNKNQNQYSENTSTNDYDSLKTNTININENQENEIDLKNFIFFYQENKGDIYFLHPINHSILMKEYEYEDDFPTQISVKFS
jgi:hypothetical protein